MEPDSEATLYQLCVMFKHLRSELFRAKEHQVGKCFARESEESVQFPNRCVGSQRIA